MIFLCNKENSVVSSSHIHHASNLLLTVILKHLGTALDLANERQTVKTRAPLQREEKVREGFPCGEIAHFAPARSSSVQFCHNPVG